MALISEATTTPTPIQLVRTSDLSAWRESQSSAATAWLQRQQFKAEAGQFAWLPDSADQPASLVVGWDGKDNLSTLGGLPFLLPEGEYRIEQPLSALQLLGWGLGAYRFDRYRSGPREPARLLVPADQNADDLANTVAAVTLVRDLINLSAEDLKPSALAEAAQQLADTHGAQCTLTVGDELLEKGYGAIHAVGRAADDAPRLIDFSWGKSEHPRITLIGKGVCFDSGGLDLKPANNMRTMKKDMGGAAQVLGLAQMIMSADLPVRLRVLIPAVENAISGNAFRPGDVLQTYKGITVEVDNTDAEGRLVLCDALAIAAEDKPALVVDFATLTGAARSAVGAEVAAMFCNDDKLASELSELGAAVDDALWRLPLHQPYGYLLESKVADCVNSTGTPFAGAITAALFLEKFIGEHPWVHFDIMAFNTRARPGRPEGGEAMAVRAVFEYLRKRYPV
ncbi:MAG: leucyl aminopeptidase family protein [Pseudomonadales bacterium]|nr:leucyl aminopeptidase family protein [Pseudomonadales bacterium]